MIDDMPFKPPIYLRNSMLQTYLASSSLRYRGDNRLVRTSVELLIHTGEGGQLGGYLNRTDGEPKGLVLLIHGWEGSADAPYMVGTGLKLLNQGFDVFRLNLRDHGATHHLNSGIFMGTLIEETFGAVKNIAATYNRTGNFHIIGVSIGGSFALRIAKLCGEKPIEGLKRVVCINPPLDPCDATIRLDRNPLIRNHFLKKWKRSLRKKEASFPGVFDFSEAYAAENCMELTEALIPRHSSYASAIDYFKHYTTKENYLDSAAVSVTVITAEDDPIINADHFRQAGINENVDLIIHPYGGHCGFIENLRMDSWFHGKIMSLFD